MLQFARGICFGVNVGDFLHLEGALHSNGIVNISAYEEQGFVVVVFFRKFFNLRVKVKGTLNICGDFQNFSGKAACFALVNFAQSKRRVYCEKVKNRHLGGISLCGGNGNFGAGVGINYAVGKLCYRASHYVDYGRHMGAAVFHFAHGADCVKGFAGLA